MDKFLETYNLPKLNLEESGNLNKLIIPSEIETVIKKLPKNKSPGPGEFHQVKAASQVNFTIHSEENYNVSF